MSRQAGNCFLSLSLAAVKEARLHLAEEALSYTYRAGSYPDAFLCLYDNGDVICRELNWELCYSASLDPGCENFPKPNGLRQGTANTDPLYQKRSLDQGTGYQGL